MLWGGKSTFKLVHIVGKIQSLVTTTEVSVFLLSISDHSKLLQAPRIPSHVVLSIFKPAIRHSMLLVLGISDLFYNQLEKLLLKGSLDMIRPAQNNLCFAI